MGSFFDILFRISDGFLTASESLTITVVTGDTSAPKINSVSVSNKDTTSIDISWITDEPGTSQVEYWGSQRELSPLQEDFSTQHNIRLTDLIPGKTYRYRILSTDRAGNLATSAEYSLTTLPAFSVSELSVTPGEASVGEQVTISVLVTNNMDVPGSYDLVLRIANAREATTTVYLAGGAQEKATFTTTRYATGTFLVDVNGITGSLVVPAPQQKTATWPTLGMIAGGTMVVLTSSVAGVAL